MEKTLVSKYTTALPDEQSAFVQEVILRSTFTDKNYTVDIENSIPIKVISGYEAFFQRVIRGDNDSTAAYWTTYEGANGVKKRIKRTAKRLYLRAEHRGLQFIN